jgi:anthranilate phosphoribosyltransferase
MRLLETHHCVIVHGEGGLDEITLSGDTVIWEIKDGELWTWMLSLEEIGLPERSIADIRGGTKEENAATMRRAFQGDPGPIRDIILVNSAAVLLVGDLVSSIPEGIELAAETIGSGAALAKLDGLIELSQRLGRDAG